MTRNSKPAAFAALALALIVGSTVWVRSFEDSGPVEAAPTAGPAADVPEPAVAAGPFPATELQARAGESTGEFVERQQQLLSDPAAFAAVRERDLAELQRLHAAEPVDPAWKQEAEAALESITASDTIAASGISPASYRADCRSRSCRVSATFGSSGDAEDWQNMFVTMTGDTFQRTRMHVVRTGPEAYSLEIFGARR
jgi:hypothetical protein